MWIEVFRTGTHTSADGKPNAYTEADLDKIVSTYNGQSAHEAPLVIGHPETNQPAYGWITELKRVNDRMLAYADQVSSKMVDAVRQGMFKKVSIALYGNGLLKHIGLLGAVPPAVKGLSPVQFNEEPSTLMDLEIERIFAEPDFFTKLGEFFANLKPNPNPKKEDDLAMTKEFEDKVNAMEGALNDLNTKVTTLETANIALKTDLAAKDGIIAGLTRSHEVARFSETIEGLVKEGKVLPGEVEGLVAEFTGTLEVDKGRQYAEGKPTLAAQMIDRLTKRPVLVEPGTGHFANRKDAAKDIPEQFAVFGDALDQSGIAIDKEIRAYMEKTPNTTYEMAVAAVCGG